MAAVIGDYLALFQKHKLAPGERGHVLVLAGSVDQARTVFGYADGFLTESKALEREVKATTASEIRLAQQRHAGRSPEFVSVDQGQDNPGLCVRRSCYLERRGLRNSRC